MKLVPSVDRKHHSKSLLLYNRVSLLALVKLFIRALYNSSLTIRFLYQLRPNSFGVAVGILSKRLWISILAFESRETTHSSQYYDNILRVDGNVAFKERFLKCLHVRSTGSSLMPQKRNPDSLELIRGRTAVIIGHVSRMHAQYQIRDGTMIHEQCVVCAFFSAPDSCQFSKDYLAPITRICRYITHLKSPFLKKKTIVLRSVSGVGLWIFIAKQ